MRCVAPLCASRPDVKSLCGLNVISPGAYPPPEGLKIQIFHHNILTITPSGDSAGYTVQNSV